METGQITAIEAQVRHKGRVSIFVDGEFAVGLDETVALSLHLKVGQAFTKEQLQEATAAEERHQAMEDAFHLLGFRSRSTRELADRLRQKGYDESIVTYVAQRLTELGYVDDAAFATSWVNARGKTRGNRLLQQELRQKGVAKETVLETLSEARDTETEFQAARTVAVRRVGEMPKDRSREGQAKLSAFLQRRGFGWESIRRVLRELYTHAAVEEIDPDAEEPSENP